MMVVYFVMSAVGERHSEPIFQNWMNPWTNCDILRDIHNFVQSPKFYEEHFSSILHAARIECCLSKYLLSKHYDLSNYRSKNFNEFVNSQIKMDYVITVCNNANNEVCPIWPNKDQIIHWDIEDPVKLLNETNDLNKKDEIIEKVFNHINENIKELLNEK